MAYIAIFRHNAIMRATDFDGSSDITSSAILAVTAPTGHCAQSGWVSFLHIITTVHEFSHIMII